MRDIEPNFDVDYAAGAQTEAWVRDVLRPSLETQSVETKLDRGFAETGNIYVETECHYPTRGWKPTGIANPDTSRLWLYDLDRTGVALVFDVDVLRDLARDGRVSKPKECIRGDHPTRGVLLSLRKVFTPGILGTP